MKSERSFHTAQFCSQMLHIFCLALKIGEGAVSLNFFLPKRVFRKNDFGVVRAKFLKKFRTENLFFRKNDFTGFRVKSKRSFPTENFSLKAPQCLFGPENRSAGGFVKNSDWKHVFRNNDFGGSRGKIK